MKKIICLVLAMFICANNVFAYGNVNYDDFNEYKSKYRILYGALLVIGGAVLAYDGFRTVKVNKSKPSVNMNFSSFWFTDNSRNVYALRASGDIINTGNVNLKNVTVWARYRTLDSSGNFEGYQPNIFGTKITYDGGGNVVNLVVGDSTNWTHRESYIVSVTNPPEGNDAISETNPNEDYIYHGSFPSSTPTTLFDIVNIEYDYKKKYKDEMNNPYEGILGVLLIGGGAYLLIDYIVSLRRFDYYMKKKNMNIYVENDMEEVQFKLSKRL